MITGETLADGKGLVDNLNSHRIFMMHNLRATCNSEEAGIESRKSEIKRVCVCAEYEQGRESMICVLGCDCQMAIEIVDYNEMVSGGGNRKL